MAKRKDSHDEELPFVALMDTMTNVVGVLIIVLVMMAISLANAVKKVMSDMPPATQQQVEETQQTIEKLQKKIQEENDQLVKLEAFKNQTAKLAALDSEVMKLRKAAQETGKQLVDLDPLTNAVARLDGELDATKKEVAGEEARIAELKVQISAIPDAKPQPGKEVHLPAAKPIPKNATIERFIVTSTGIYYINPEDLKASFLKEMDSMGARDISKKSVKAGNLYKTQYDHKQMKEYFEKHPPNWSDFDKVQVLLEDPRKNAGVSGTLKPTAFEPFPQALSFSSNFQKQLRKIHDKPDSVAIFRVLDDGYENYLAARDLSDRAGIAAGWEFGGADISLRQEMPDILIDPIIDPNATPTPMPKPAPSGTPFIPAPSLKLD
jgi:Tfp pilus assembly protein PilO